MLSSVICKIKYLFQTGAIHIIFGTFFSKFVTFFGSIVVVRLLSKEEYGLVSYVENIYGYIFIFAGFGLSNAILRYVVIPDDIRKKRGYYKYIKNTDIFFNVVICLSALVINNIVSYPQEFSDAKKWMPLLIVLVLFQDLMNIALYTIRSFFKNKLYTYLSLMVAVVIILGRILGAYIGGVGGTVLSRLIINAFFAILLIILVRNKLFRKCEICSISTQEKKEVTRYAIQYMVTNGIWFMFTLNDTLLLSHITKNLDMVADYKVASVIPGCLSILSSAVGVYISPYFVKHENDRNWIQRNFKKIYICTAGTIFAISLFLFLFSKYLIYMLYGDEYHNIVPLMQGLIIVSFINCGFRYITASILAAMGKIKYNMVVSFVGVIMQMALDYYLVNKYMYMGIVYSNAIVYSLMSLALLFIFIRMYYGKDDKCNS